MTTDVKSIVSSMEDSKQDGTAPGKSCQATDSQDINNAFGFV